MEIPQEKYVYLRVDEEFIKYSEDGAEIDFISNTNYALVSPIKMEIFKAVAFDVFEWEDDQKWRILLEMFKAIYETPMEESSLTNTDLGVEKLQGEFLFAAKEFVKQLK